MKAWINECIREKLHMTLDLLCCHAVQCSPQLPEDTDWFHAGVAGFWSGLLSWDAPTHSFIYFTLIATPRVRAYEVGEKSLSLVLFNPSFPFWKRVIHSLCKSERQSFLAREEFVCLGDALLWRVGGLNVNGILSLVCTWPGLQRRSRLRAWVSVSS